MKIYLIFSSCVPLVNRTRPHSNSLNAMPRWVPPQAPYSQSANTDGTLSDRTSWRNAVLLNVVPPAPADFLNASRMRRSSLSLTAKEKNWGINYGVFNTNRESNTQYYIELEYTYFRIFTNWFYDYIIWLVILRINLRIISGFFVIFLNFVMPSIAFYSFRVRSKTVF